MHVRIDLAGARRGSRRAGACGRRPGAAAGVRVVGARRMIRDLRAGPPRTAPPPSDALAFSREHIAALGRTSAAQESIGAFTIAVTAPRTQKCKRGVAAHIAAYLAN